METSNYFSSAPSGDGGYSSAPLGDGGYSSAPSGDGGYSSAPLGDGGVSRIFLIGIMGSGKTYWSQRIAEMLNWDWIDLDQQIEKAANMPVREIFATEGEEYFRLKERDTLQQFADVKNIVIATGGGTPCFHHNMQWMNENGITIWLNVDSAVLTERLKRGRHRRPLISHLNEEEIHDFIVNKIKEREPFYAQASHHINGSEIKLDHFKKIINDAQ